MIDTLSPSLLVKLACLVAHVQEMDLYSGAGRIDVDTCKGARRRSRDHRVDGHHRSRTTACATLMEDDSRDLAHVVHEVLVNKLRQLGQRSDAGWVDFTINDTFSLMVDLAAAGVDLSMSDYVDTSEHGIQIVYAHGNNCDECRAIQSLAFDAIKGTS